MIPTPLGPEAPIQTIPAAALGALGEVTVLLVESERTAMRQLARLGVSRPEGSVVFRELSEHTRPADLDGVIKALEEGAVVGVLSEAGCPVIADPGADLVRRCHGKGIRVVAHAGPSSIILAVMASGFSGQRFAFQGYLPIPPEGRTRRIREIERRALDEGETQVFMETPYRNERLWADLLRTCRADTPLCVACDLTTPREYVGTRRVREWAGVEPPIHKRPALFLIGRWEGGQ